MNRPDLLSLEFVSQSDFLNSSCSQKSEARKDLALFKPLPVKEFNTKSEFFLTFLSIQK